MYPAPELLIQALIAEHQAEAERWRRSSASRQDVQPDAGKRPPRRRVHLHLPVVRHRSV